MQTQDEPQPATPVPPEEDAAGRAAALRALLRMGLVAPGAEPELERLTGGVSSDIWRVELADGPVCIKRALPKLRVKQDWHAPVGRNAAEVAWIRAAAAVVPDAVPELLGEDRAEGLFAMRYLDPADHPVWKRRLRDGAVDQGFAEQVADRLVRIHAATAHDAAVAAAFPNDATFHAIRLEPYLEATARVHADLAPALHRLVRVTAASRHALVHGDVSPKNILVGPAGPVFLDAECAVYGDPAFDLAFCLNHLLLKCLWTPAATAAFLEAFGRLAGTYLAGVGWEDAAGFEARGAALLPGLFLARVDGKSPVEYVTREADRERVRRVARPLIERPVARLDEVRRRWQEELEG